MLPRLVRFELDLKRESSERVEAFGWGRLILNPSTSAMWTDNYLELDSSAYDAGELTAMADELLSAHGMQHRLVVPVDPAVGARLQPEFRDRGWETERSVYMVHTRDPDSRGQGLASTVVLAAVDALHRAGHELTFIVADADDWAWRLYERLGFDPVGVSCAFLRKPPSPAA